MMAGEELRPYSLTNRGSGLGADTSLASPREIFRALLRAGPEYQDQYRQYNVCGIEGIAAKGSANRLSQGHWRNAYRVPPERRKIELAELVDELWTLPAPDDAFGSFVTEAFRAGGLDYPRATVATSALEIRANLLRAGRYLSIIPEFWLQLPGRHPFIKKLAVDLPVTGAPIGIITLKNRKPSPGGAAFHRLRARSCKTACGEKCLMAPRAIRWRRDLTQCASVAE